MTDAILDRVEGGLIHFTDGSTLSVPDGVTVAWESNPWHSAWVFSTPAARAGKGLPMIISTGRIDRQLAERAMQWLREQPSMRER